MAEKRSGFEKFVNFKKKGEIRLKKLAIITILTMTFLAITAPMISAGACSGGHSSLFHSVSWGHNGTAHWTSHAIRNSTARATVFVRGSTHANNNRTFTAHNGATAFASVPARVTDTHSHDFW